MEISFPACLSILDRMSRLMELDVSACGLSQIPEIFHMLPMLHVLDLSNNNLSQLPISRH